MNRSDIDLLLAEVRAAGYTLARDGHKLVVQGSRPPAPALMARIREAAADLLPLLPEPPVPADPEVAWQAGSAMRQVKKKVSGWGWRRKVLAGYAAFAVILVALSSISQPGPYGSQGSQVAWAVALVVILPILIGILVAMAWVNPMARPLAAWILGLRPALAPSPMRPIQGRRGPLPRELKRQVWLRDGGRCVQCGSAFDIQYDHVIPVARGGATSPENLQLLCSRCNQRKGAGW